MHSRTGSAVVVQGLTKSYGAVEAVRGIDFTVERGETFALLGPNGAGKSSTIEILEGFRDRTGGEVRVLGVDPATGGRAWRARLGIVLQSSGENGAATVREQVAHFASFAPRPRDVDEVIEAVGLTAKAKSRIRSLSGGQRRRVDVALGIVGRPDVLFLDEPTTGFDPEARRAFWELVRGLQRDGTTILLTTHYLDEAAQLSDRAAVIAGGELVALGPIDELGGAEARLPRVRWRDADGLHEEVTTTPAAVIAAAVARAGGEPQGLEVVRPSLEDVYLDLIHRPTDGKAAGGKTTDGKAAGGRAADAQEGMRA